VWRSGVIIDHIGWALMRNGECAIDRMN